MKTLKDKFKTKRPYPLLLNAIIVKLKSVFSINKSLAFFWVIPKK